VAVFDGDVAPKQRSPGGNGVANLWITGEFPIDPNGTTEGADPGRRAAAGGRHHFPHRRLSACIDRGSAFACRPR
jgi:hypothetical protein